MSKYTTQVRFICETNSDLTESVGYNDVNTVIESSRSKIFNFSYPIFDEAYKSVLETKILKHYYTREIGMETVGLWKLKLDTKMNEIMPYYNQLYNSQLLEFDVFNDVDYERKSDREIDVNKSGDNSDTEKVVGTGTNVSNGSKNITKELDGISRFSDTPQGGLDGVLNDTYLTTATRNTSDDNITESDNSTETNNNTVDANKSGEFNETLKNVDDYTEHVFGKMGTRSYSDMLIEFRKTFLNIDMQVVDDLEELFMSVW